MTLSPIDNESPAGSWRAALDPSGYCKACGQKVCCHSDLEYQGLVPPLHPRERAAVPGAAA